MTAYSILRYTKCTDVSKWGSRLPSDEPGPARVVGWGIPNLDKKVVHSPPLPPQPPSPPAAQLIECIEDWTQAIDEGKQVDVIRLDFKAAFDKVPHKRLLRKIWGYGIRGNIYRWIKDFTKTEEAKSLGE